eukprot:NODE_686_length_2834_cov_4.942002.p1 GENE.NODE_686_length_2834_cov_4.942002~~NODE_686_length_2834_cov_4.942002.p1  ORF type:complete len:804 (+),score=203.58 NODE_686_length_2834_cov_4.942002:82-2412(+)
MLLWNLLEQEGATDGLNLSRRSSEWQIESPAQPWLSRPGTAGSPGSSARVSGTLSPHSARKGGTHELERCFAHAPRLPWWACSSTSTMDTLTPMPASSSAGEPLGKWRLENCVGTQVRSASDLRRDAMLSSTTNSCLASSSFSPRLDSSARGSARSSQPVDAIELACSMLCAETEAGPPARTVRSPQRGSQRMHAQCSTAPGSIAPVGVTAMAGYGSGGGGGGSTQQLRMALPPKPGYPPPECTTDMMLATPRPFNIRSVPSQPLDTVAELASGTVTPSDEVMYGGRTPTSLHASRRNSVLPAADGDGAAAAILRRTPSRDAMAMMDAPGNLPMRQDTFGHMQQHHTPARLRDVEWRSWTEHTPCRGSPSPGAAGRLGSANRWSPSSLFDNDTSGREAPDSSRRLRRSSSVALDTSAELLSWQVMQTPEAESSDARHGLRLGWRSSPYPAARLSESAPPPTLSQRSVVTSAGVPAWPSAPPGTPTEQSLQMSRRHAPWTGDGVHPSPDIFCTLRQSASAPQETPTEQPPQTSRRHAPSAADGDQCTPDAFHAPRQFGINYMGGSFGGSHPASASGHASSCPRDTRRSPPRRPSMPLADSIDELIRSPCHTPELTGAGPTMLQFETLAARRTSISTTQIDEEEIEGQKEQRVADVVAGLRAREASDVLAHVGRALCCCGCCTNGGVSSHCCCDAGGATVCSGCHGGRARDSEGGSSCAASLRASMAPVAETLHAHLQLLREYQALQALRLGPELTDAGEFIGRAEALVAGMLQLTPS